MKKQITPHRVERHCIKVGSEIIEFRLSYADRSSLSVSVHPDQSVTVQAPLDKPLEEILKRIQRRGLWILKQRDYFERFQPLPPARRYVSGEAHWYLGRRYRLKVRVAQDERIVLTRGILIAYVHENRNGSVQTLLHNWYRWKAKKVLEERLAWGWEMARRAGLPEPRIALREMKRRWGSCAKSGRISLNTELIKAPVSCIEYVIVHELCHLRHRDHSPQFFRLLGRLMPDWRERKARLERIQI